MNIALNCGENYLALADTLTASFCNSRFNKVEACAGCICSIYELRQEDDLLLIFLTHEIQCRDQLLIYNVQFTHLGEQLFRKNRCLVLKPL